VTRLLKFALAFLAALLIGHQNAQASSWPVLTDTATMLVGQHVSVSCSDVDATTDNDLPSSRIWGYTFPNEHSVTLSRLACAALLTLWAHPRMNETYTLFSIPGYNRGLEGMAVHALAHELGHIKYGYLATSALSERAAECYATANDERVALAFGVSKAWARWMHRAGESYHSLLPAIYRDGGCP
jgi:hypothetical protein